MKALRLSFLAAMLAIVCAVAFVPRVNAATVDLVLAKYSSGSAEYNTLWQDSTPIIFASDFQANRFRLKPVAFTANATLTVESGSQVRIGAVAGNVTLTIPSAVTAGDAYVLDIQDISGALDATHTVTVNSTSGNINGSATASLATAYGGMRLISNGTNWFKR